MLVKFEIMKASWFANGWVVGPEAPLDVAYFNEEERRWEIAYPEEQFFKVIQAICRTNNVRVKICFPPYESPTTELPIIEILDTEE